MIDALRRFHVGAVAAFLAQDDGILSGRGQQHEFMGQVSSHHAGIRSHTDHLRNAGPGEDALIGPQTARVVAFQILLGGVEGIGVLHGEFPDADQPRTGTGLIPEFGLNLINHKRIAAVGGGVFPHKLDRGLFVGHSQHHFRAVSVRKPKKLAADGGVPAGFLPKGSGQRHGEGNLLPVQSVHFLPDDFFDFLCDSLQRRERGINAVCHIFHVASPQHERVACHHAVRRRFLETVANQF